jgi:hypothetical protein
LDVTYGTSEKLAIARHPTESWDPVSLGFDK